MRCPMLVKITRQVVFWIPKLGSAGYPDFFAPYALT
jgi:hypothetical protein